MDLGATLAGFLDEGDSSTTKPVLAAFMKIEAGADLASQGELPFLDFDPNEMAIFYVLLLTAT